MFLADRHPEQTTWSEPGRLACRLPTSGGVKTVQRWHLWAVSSRPLLARPPPGCHWGQHREAGEGPITEEDNHTGGSSCDLDALITRSPGRPTGSQSPAKWPPLVALPVPTLPHREEGCGLLSSGAARLLSPPRPDERKQIIDSRLVRSHARFFFFQSFFLSLARLPLPLPSFFSPYCQHPLYPILTSFLFSFVVFFCLWDVNKCC